MSVTLSQFGSSSANAQSTVAILNEIFAAFPNRFRFTSGYRTPERNAAANGVANSFHITGEAGDFVPIDGRFPAGEKEAIGRLISKYGYEVIQHNAGSGLHYHIEPSPSGKKISTVSPVSNIAIAVGVLLLVLLIKD